MANPVVVLRRPGRGPAHAPCPAGSFPQSLVVRSAYVRNSSNPVVAADARKRPRLSCGRAEADRAWAPAALGAVPGPQAHREEMRLAQALERAHPAPRPRCGTAAASATLRRVDEPPIRVFFKGGSWRVDYGSYIDSFHTTRAEAIAAASVACAVEQRELAIEA